MSPTSPGWQEEKEEEQESWPKQEEVFAFFPKQVVSVEAWNTPSWRGFRNGAQEECRMGWVKEGSGEAGLVREACILALISSLAFSCSAKRPRDVYKDKTAWVTTAFLFGSSLTSLAFLPLKETGRPPGLIFPWLSAGNSEWCHLHSLLCLGTAGEGIYVNRLAPGGIW